MHTNPSEIMGLAKDGELIHNNDGIEKLPSYVFATIGKRASDQSLNMITPDVREETAKRSQQNRLERGERAGKWMDRKKTS
jgi:hypothetical protein